MSYFMIRRGGKHIGGTCCELCSDDNRILIDFGANLPGMDEESPISDKDLKQAVFGNGNKYQAVLFTHYHGDHYGLYKDIPSKIPLYMGKTAREILEIVTEYIDINAQKKGIDRIKAMEAYVPGCPLKIKGVDKIKVIPLVVDHSAIDAYMFYIEMAGKRILYTGDFRDHGIASERKRFWNLIESDKYIPEKIDVLITEGTMLSRTEERKQNIVSTEAELGEEAGRRFLKHKYNFVMVSSTNLDSIMEFYHNTPDDMPFVCDIYQLKVISKAMQGRKNWLDMYKPKRMADNKIKPIYILMEKWNDDIGKIIEDNKAHNLFLPLYSVKPKDEYAALKDGFVMLVRPNRYPENGKNRFERALEYFSKSDESQVSIMYSMWQGYLSGDKEDKAITGFLKGHDRNDLHVSGHAYPETILKLIQKTDPRVIIPMHTEMADEMSTMPIFSNYVKRINPITDDKQVFDLEKMDTYDI